MVQARSGTLAERYERGRRLRKKVLREKHGDLLGPSERDAVPNIRRLRSGVLLIRKPGLPGKVWKDSGVNE
jgi:hypothetical protein